MPVVSVVIPTHDRRALVREAVESALAQASADFEVIVVDDGSADGTAESLEREFGGRIRLLAQPNRGVSAARNRGVAACRGEYVAFLDSDDLWRPRKLAAQLRWFGDNPSASICQTEEIWIRGNVRVNPCRHHAKPEGDVFVASLERCLISPSAAMLRRDVLEQAGGFDENLPACEDYDLWLRLARAHSFGLVREPLVVRRGGHADQLSRRHWGMDRFRVESLRKLLNEPLAPERRRAAIDVMRRKCAILALGAEKRGREAEAARYRELAEAHA